VRSIQAASITGMAAIATEERALHISEGTAVSLTVLDSDLCAVYRA